MFQYLALLCMVRGGDVVVWDGRCQAKRDERMMICASYATMFLLYLALFHLSQISSRFYDPDKRVKNRGFFTTQILTLSLTRLEWIVISWLCHRLTRL